VHKFTSRLQKPRSTWLLYLIY